jgi:hypothetical protein
MMPVRSRQTALDTATGQLPIRTPYAVQQVKPTNATTYMPRDTDEASRWVQIFTI